MSKEYSELITWNHTLSVGVKIIDDQHKGLVNLINEMFNHVTGDKIQEYIYLSKVIHRLHKYAEIHFATEEQLILATSFPGYADHKNEHNSFIITVTEHVKDNESGKKIPLSTFTKFLKDWILSHIAVKDKQYFEYFKKIATRKADGRLTITLEDIPK